MEVKDIQGNILIDALVTEQAVKVDELMKQHSITLSWVSVTDDELPLGAYIEHEGVKYSLLAPYKPEQSDEATYAYKPVFEHPIMRWQYIPFFFYTYSEGKVVSKELDWNLTDNPANFMKAVCDAILNETGEDWSYEISADLSASASQSFGNTDIFSALNAIAGAFETEWWFDYANKIVYLSKASFGSAVTLEVGQNIGVPSKNQSKDGYYTRFYAFGSTRNIEQNYAGSNVNSIVNKRLTLNPAKYPNGYIDIREGLTESEILVKTLEFDDIYPSSSLTIADVKVRLMWRLDSDKKKVQIGTDSNGNPVYDQYAIWYFKVPGLQFDKDSIISGKPLSVHFNSGALNGREFELTYHDTEEDVETSDGTSVHVEKGDFEINFIEEGTFIIPAISGLVPNDGDEIALFNVKMPEEYKTSAYNDLEEAVLKEIAKQDVDNNNYTFESNKEAFFESNPNLTVGRKVLYKNGNSVLETRVIKLETQLDYAFEQKITIGNEQIKGTTQTLKEEVVNANQNIDLISAINESTQQLVQSYQRTQKALLDSMAKWGDMWSLDAIKGIVRTRYNIVSEQEVISNRRATGAGSGTGSGYGRLDNWAEWDADTMMTYVLSAKLGVSLNERLKNIELNGSGLKEDDLKKYLDNNNYLQEKDIADLRTTVNGLDDILNGGTKDVIDTWNEVVDFLDGYKDSEDLATILSGMNTDIANRVLIEDFNKLEEAVLAIDISGLSKRLDVAEQAIKTNATAIATNATNITNLNNRVKTLEDLGLTLEGDAEKGYYIKSAYSFVSQGEIISGRRASGSGSGGGGGISEITAQMVVDALGYVPYSSSNPAGYITSAAIPTALKNPYALTINGHTYDGSEAVNITISAGGGVADSVDWANVYNKPTTLGGYGITDALSTSGGTIAGDLVVENTLRVKNYLKIIAWPGYGEGTTDMWYNGNTATIHSGASHIELNGNIVLHSGNYSDYALPLSGGNVTSASNTPLGIKTTSANTWVGIKFYGSDGTIQGNLGVYKDSPCYVNAALTDRYTLIHSGNISEQSVNYASSAGLVGYSSVTNLTHPALQYWFDWGEFTGIEVPGSAYKWGIHIGSPDSNYNFQIGATSQDNSLYARFKHRGAVYGWREIAFIDSNVASATKLQTAQYLWGQPFDGTYGVNGQISINFDSTSFYIEPSVGGTGMAGISWWRNVFTRGVIDASPLCLNSVSDGNVLIGTSIDSGYKLFLKDENTASNAIYIETYNSNGEASIIYSSGYQNAHWAVGVACGMANHNVFSFYNINVGKTVLYVDTAGNLTATGELISSRRATSSDARLKDNINRLIAEDCLAIVRSLQPSSWDWKEDGQHSLGFIAQDVEPLMPYAVTKIKDEELGMRLNLQYDQFFAPVVGAIQCLDSEVEQLKKRVKYLENKLQEYGYNRY